MVDALRRASRWPAAPEGRIIDVRPAELYPEVEIGLQDGRVMRVGRLAVDDDRRARHAAADAAVLAVVQQQELVVGDRAEFPFFRHADSAAELRDFIAARWHDAQLLPETYARAVELLGEKPGSRIWLREQVGIRTLRRARL
jgi:hypothetical protein